MIAYAPRHTGGFSNTEIFSLKMDTSSIKMEACCMILEGFVYCKVSDLNFFKKPNTNSLWGKVFLLDAILVNKSKFDQEYTALSSAPGGIILKFLCHFFPGSTGNGKLWA